MWRCEAALDSECWLCISALLNLQYLNCSTSHPPSSSAPALPYLPLSIIPHPLSFSSSISPLLSPPAGFLQGEAARFPVVSEAARWLVCDARRRGGGCQVRVHFLLPPLFSVLNFHVPFLLISALLAQQDVYITKEEDEKHTSQLQLKACLYPQCNLLLWLILQLNLSVLTI